MSIITDFIDYLNESCTAYHAVDAARTRLIQANFTELDEKHITDWNLTPNGKYFFIRNGTTIIAFTIGNNYKPGQGFTVIGAHTDSPCLKVKPNACSAKSDSLMLNTQPYGGGLWHTWFDRDLGIAGRVIYKGDEDVIKSKLIRIDDPLARIPNLAIHLTSGSEREHFAPNLQEHAKALLTMNKDFYVSDDAVKHARYHPYLVDLVLSYTGVTHEELVDLELQLIDIQPSSLGGYGNKEYVLSGRLDNLCSAYQSLRALIDSSSAEQLSAQRTINLAMLFDHEEVGSNSCSGAGSSLFMDTLRVLNERLIASSPASSSNNAALSLNSTLVQALRHSLVVSADMAHGLHPNYTSKHDPDHAPKVSAISASFSLILLLFPPYFRLTEAW